MIMYIEILWTSEQNAYATYTISQTMHFTYRNSAIHMTSLQHPHYNPPTFPHDNFLI
jgi:hypothetical protein